MALCNGHKSETVIKVAGFGCIGEAASRQGPEGGEELTRRRGVEAACEDLALKGLVELSPKQRATNPEPEQTSPKFVTTSVANTHIETRRRRVLRQTAVV